jgi:hypothetical protein
MDQPDGATHRGQDLRDRVKKHKKALREKRQLLKKTRITRMSLPTMPVFPNVNNLVAETKQ